MLSERLCYNVELKISYFFCYQIELMSTNIEEIGLVSFSNQKVQTIRFAIQHKFDVIP